jgi:hypothetical protein
MPREGPEPILPAQDLIGTRAFYESLGFNAGYHDDRYDILRRGNLVVHLESHDDLLPATNGTSSTGAWRTQTCYTRNSLHSGYRPKGSPASPHRVMNPGECANSRSRIHRATWSASATS